MTKIKFYFLALCYIFTQDVFAQDFTSADLFGQWDVYKQTDECENELYNLKYREITIIPHEDFNENFEVTIELMVNEDSSFIAPFRLDFTGYFFEDRIKIIPLQDSFTEWPEPHFSFDTMDSLRLAIYTPCLTCICGGIHFMEKRPTDTKEISANTNWKVYPNPTSDKVIIQNLNFSNHEEAQISLFNAQGILLKTEFISRQTSEVSLEKLSKGIYFIQIDSEKNRIVEKVLKN